MMFHISVEAMRLSEIMIKKLAICLNFSRVIILRVSHWLRI